MPWKECSVMDGRMRFIVRLKEGESMASLCREFCKALSGQDCILSGSCSANVWLWQLSMCETMPDSSVTRAA